MLSSGPARAISPRQLVITNFNVSPPVIRVGEAFNVTITVRNNGPDLAIGQNPAPGFVYNQGESWRSLGFQNPEDASRVGISVSGPRGDRFPYRWGIGQPLSIGSRTLHGQIVFTKPGVYAFSAASFVGGQGMNRADKIISGLRVVRGAAKLPNNYRPPVSPATIVVNGDTVDSPEPPIIVNGTVFVPIRFPSEALGAAVRWNPAQRRVVIRNGGRTVRLEIGSLTARVNAEDVTLYERPFLYHDHAYVPLRFLSESLGARVTWEGQTRTIRIRT
jgi:hypothetical protein